MVVSGGSTHSKVVVLPPIGLRARSDITPDAFVSNSQKGFCKTSAVVTPIGSQAAVTHSPEVFVGVGHRIDIADGKLRVVPHRVVTVCSIVGKTNIVDIVVTSGLARTSSQKHMRRDAVGRIEVIVVGILDGGFANSIGPSAIPPSDEQGFVQIGRIGHRILLVHQNFVEQVGQFGRGRNGHTAQIHLRIEVVVCSARVVQVCDFTSGAASSCSRNDILIAHKDNEGRSIGGVAIADESLDS